MCTGSFGGTGAKGETVRAGCTNVYSECTARGGLPEGRHPEKRQRRTTPQRCQSQREAGSKRKGEGVAHEVGEKLEKTRRIINCVTHSSRVEQEED